MSEEKQRGPVDCGLCNGTGRIAVRVLGSAETFSGHLVPTETPGVADCPDCEGEGRRFWTGSEFLTRRQLERGPH